MTQRLRLVLVGPPGAGKGTQALLLTEQLKISQISSGDLFRRHLQAGTPLGLNAAEYMNRGVLVPDEVTIDITLERVMSLDDEEGFILDGFPRNRTQAEALEDALKRRSRDLDKVVYMELPEAEMVERLAGRFVCRQCQVPYTMPAAAQTDGKGDSENGGPSMDTQGHDRRCQRCERELYQRVDDKPEAVKKRIEVYYSETVPVLDFYRERGLLAEVPGVDTVDRINQRILVALGAEVASYRRPAGFQDTQSKVE